EDGIRDYKVTGVQTCALPISRAMVGRELKELRARATPARAEVTLKVQGLEAKSDRGALALQGVDFDVRSGEILGIAGVGGNGQRSEERRVGKKCRQGWGTGGW